jgi:acyl-CoA thioesterase
MNQHELTEKVVAHIKENDNFAHWLGVEVVLSTPGYAKIKMKIRKDMINSFGSCHGGVTFGFAQTALAFASNNYGNIEVALETGMAFTSPLFEGDEIIAETNEESRNNKVSVYSVLVTKTDGTKVGVFRGSVYRTKRKYFPDIEIENS